MEVMFYSNRHTTNFPHMESKIANYQLQTTFIFFCQNNYVLKFALRINNYLLPRNNVKEEF